MMQPKRWNDFLKQIAEDYEVTGKPRDVFLARFAYENWNKDDKELLKLANVPSPETYKKHASVVYKKFSKDKPHGCPGIDAEDRAPGKFEILRDWLAQTKHPEWLTQQKSEIAQKILNSYREICQALIAEKHRLTTNPLTVGDGTTFEYKDVYVPLGLVERKRQPKHDRQDSSQDGSKLYQPTEYEVTRKFENNEFFEEVLAKGDSLKSQGKRLAIIGEPGAGKTTLLQQIADWVFDSTEDGVAIWVSLAELDKRSLEDYLLNDWLKGALRKVEVTSEMKEALAELFNSGRVWLLLDGIDEMGVLNPLGTIASQLRGFLASARVVLTCQLNVWDAGKNALENFDIYRNLDFSEVQVGEFISRWFASCSELGEQLQMELSKPGKERIQDLVKNPLRLTLLCHFWQRRQGELPSTKAGLYQRYVEVFYEWKQEYFPTNYRQRQELNQALGELAKQAISQPYSRFRLTHSFVLSVLAKYDESILKLAMDLGWLNKIGVAKENPDEPVYAFYHSTFQEYFAALAINDWHYFLNHVPENPKRGTYRIFEPQWKEVILLWLGREDLDEEHKEELIRALVSFEDDCEKFYYYRAYFLAAAGIAEFEDCRLANEIVKQIIEWSISQNIPAETKQVVAETVAKTEQKRAIHTLVDLLDTKLTKDQYCQIAEQLGKLDPGNAKAVDLLIDILNSNSDDFNEECYISIFLAIVSLGEIGTGSQDVRNALIKILEKDYNSFIKRIAWINLGKNDLDYTVSLLNRILSRELSENDRLYFADILGIIDPNSWKVIAIFFELLHSEDENIRDNAFFALGYVGSKMQDAIECYRAIPALIQLLKSKASEDTGLEQKVLFCLGEIGTGDPDAINFLTNLLKNSQNEILSLQAAESLWKIGGDIYIAIKKLKKIMYNTEYDYIRREAAIKLKHIDPDSLEATEVLIEHLRRIKSDTLYEIADSLKKTRHPEMLKKIVASFQNCPKCDKWGILWHCAQNMSYLDFYNAFHKQSITTHPEALEVTGTGESSLTKNLTLANLLWLQLLSHL